MLRYARQAMVQPSHNLFNSHLGRGLAIEGFAGLSVMLDKRGCSPEGRLHARMIPMPGPQRT